MATTIAPSDTPTVAPSATTAVASPETLVVDLVEVNRANVPIVGGKGANLGEMLRADLPVPPGFVLTVAAYERMRRSGAEAGSVLDVVHARQRRGIDKSDFATDEEIANG